MVAPEQPIYTPFFGIMGAASAMVFTGEYVTGFDVYVVIMNDSPPASDEYIVAQMMMCGVRNGFMKHIIADR